MGTQQARWAKRIRGRGSDCDVGPDVVVFKRKFRVL
jgi:hypothetical protein